MTNGALDAATDPREFRVAVAAPAALLAAKPHKIHDRIGSPDRQGDKDAHDVYRLLVAIDTDRPAEVLNRLLVDGRSVEAAREAIGYLETDFAQGPGASGSAMAGAAERLVGDPAGVAESVALLPRDRLGAVNS